MDSHYIGNLCMGFIMNIDIACGWNIGVYKIIHLPTGRFYIGSAGNIDKRIKNHFSKLRVRTHVNSTLQDIYDKSETEYSFYVEHTLCNTRELAYDLEQKMLDEEKENDLLINRTLDARCPIRGIDNQEEIQRRRTEGIRRSHRSIKFRKEASEKSKKTWEDSELRKKRSGGGNPFARRVSINGKIYGSVKEAEKDIGVSEKTIRKRANSPDWHKYKWPDGERRHHVIEASKVSKDPNYKPRAVRIGDIVYPTFKMASKHTNISVSNMYKKLRRGDKDISTDKRDLDGGRDLTYSELMSLI